MSFIGQAATLIVDNDNTHAGGHYTTIQEAINAASPGDRIMVTPTQTPYDGASINKSITIMGPGFGGRSLLGPFQDLEADVQGFSIMGGVSGVTITGLKVTRPISISGSRIDRNPETGATIFRPAPGSDTVSDILITRNWLASRPNANSSNSIRLYSPYSRSELKRLLVINNRIDEPIGFGGNTYVRQWTTESYFLNNRIRGSLKLATVGSGNPRGESSDVDNYAVIENNIITGGIELGRGRLRNNVITATAIYNTGSTIERNVFIEQWPTRYNNHFWGSQLPAPSQDDNRLAATIEDVLVWSGDWWQKWVLTENSPAKGYATDGGDVGLFGGLHPWNKKQMPNIPYITEFRAPVVVNQGQPLRVEVEVDLNN